MPNRFSIIFVIDPPGLVLDSILLMASIRKHMPNAHVVPYCPANKEGDLPPQIVEFFNHHRAPIHMMETEGAFDPPYKQGNKLIAAAAVRETEATLFLDTDTMVMRPFEIAEILMPGHLAVAPEGRMTWGKDPEMWPAAYRVFDMDTPDERVRLAKSNALSLPYFNAGVAAFENRTPAGSTFGQIWLETAQAIDVDDRVRGRRPWLDQIALPIAMRRAGLKAHILPKEWNLSLTHSPVKDGLPDHKNRQFQAGIDALNDAKPVIAHYHNHDALQQLRYGSIANRLIGDFTPYETVKDLRADMIGDLPKKADVLKEFHTLKAMPDRTPEQTARMRELDQIKRDIQSGKMAKRYYENWPESLIKKSSRVA